MHGIDYNETYSTEIDGITFQFLIAMAVTNKLDMQLMNVVTVHLYGLFENDMYTKIPGDIRCQMSQIGVMCTLLKCRGLFMTLNSLDRCGIII